MTDRGGRREVLATLAVVGAVGLLGVGRPLVRRLSRHPTPERCVAMLERYAEQEAHAQNRAPGDAPVPLGAPDVARCTHDLTDDEVGCALRSGYADELERCLP